MKKLFIFLCLSCLLYLQFGHTYNPSNQDTQQLNSLKIQLNKVISGNNQDLRNFYYQLKNLQNRFSQNPRLDYMLNNLKQDLYIQLYSQKIQAKTQSKEFKQNFVNEFSGGISIDDPILDECTGWYNTLDDISFAYNIPTALTISTRYRETNCGYYLPSNGDGPFQILKQDYGTGEITEDIFVKSVQDFAQFSKDKHIQYKTKLGINLTYTGFDRTGLVNHGALYNGARITGSDESGYIAQALAPKYLYDGYGAEYSGAIRYGLIPKFLKILDREIQNKY
ncbi:hypothetical protein K9M48_02965 [Candidatus Gracilibacteria bacterium]|nr:hypothetical protein [Candidatus Gracilibacteria bacterium]